MGKSEIKLCIQISYLFAKKISVTEPSSNCRNTANLNSFKAI